MNFEIFDVAEIGKTLPGQADASIRCLFQIALIFDHFSTEFIEFITRLI